MSKSANCSCVVCHKEFVNTGIHTHYIRIHTNLSKRNSSKGTKKFLLLCSCIICKIELSVQNLKQHCSTHESLPIEIKYCPKCLNLHVKPGIFCSYNCANSHEIAIETKLKISKTLLNRPKLPKVPKKLPVSTCSICDTVFYGTRSTCSDACLHLALVNAGKKAASVRKLRSKDEITLFELCASYFQIVTHNEPIFNGWDADILIYDTKTAISWNGAWHYREMNFGTHSLKQVQNRDRIKHLEIESLGWTHLVFEDQHYTPETAFEYISNLYNGGERWS
jgi:hypothetical protein